MIEHRVLTDRLLLWYRSFLLYKSGALPLQLEEEAALTVHPKLEASEAVSSSDFDKLMLGHTVEARAGEPERRRRPAPKKLIAIANRMRVKQSMP